MRGIRELSLISPPFLRRVTVNSPRWNERVREEIIRMRMLNNLINTNNPGFAYINPAFYVYNGLKMVRGWVKVGRFGSVRLFIFLPVAYPLVHPEAAISGEFFEKYMASDLHKHVYPFNVNGEVITVICGDRKFLQRWTGKLGVAHYVSDVVFPWIHCEYNRLTKKEVFDFSDILRILRGD